MLKNIIIIIIYLKLTLIIIKYLKNNNIIIYLKIMLLDT